MVEGLEEEPQLLWQQLQAIRARLDKVAPRPVPESTYEGIIADMVELGGLFVAEIEDGAPRYRLPTLAEMQVIKEHVDWWSEFMQHYIDMIGKERGK